MVWLNGIPPSGGLLNYNTLRCVFHRVRVRDAICNITWDHRSQDCRLYTSNNNTNKNRSSCTFGGENDNTYICFNLTSAWSNQHVQHFYEPTRQTNVLDLVFSSEKDMIDNVCGEIESIRYNKRCVDHYTLRIGDFYMLRHTYQNIMLLFFIIFFTFSAKLSYKILLE